LGLKPGHAFKETLDAVLNAKLDEIIKSKKDEMVFTVEYIKNNKLIDS